MTQNIALTAGIDTSKDKLDIAIHGRPGAIVVTNNSGGWQELAAHLNKQGVQRVGIEATGGYERGVRRYLQDRGFTVVVLQPKQVKGFAFACLQRAKSDKIDAGLIAACTVFRQDEDRRPPDRRFDDLADHMTFIEQIEADIARCKTRREHISNKRLLGLVQDHIKQLKAWRMAELRALAGAVNAHPDLAKRLKLVLSVQGIGQRTALALVVRIPELGQISREEIAALVGVAPFVHQSGKHKGETHIGGGRSRVRRSLYAAALPAAFRWNAALTALYQRLIARGKCHTSALIACARKLLIYANTVVARGTPWQVELAAP